MQENTVGELERKSTKKALESVERLLKKHHMIAEEDISWLMHNAVEDIEFECPVFDATRKVFRSAKFCVEYDQDLETAVTYAFKDLVIVVLRKRQEDK